MFPDSSSSIPKHLFINGNGSSIFEISETVVTKTHDISQEGQLILDDAHKVFCCHICGLPCNGFF